MQDYMQYLPHMQEIKSEILNKVLTQVQSYDESQFSAKDVKNALNQTHLSIEHLKALLSSAAEDFIEELAFKSAKVKQKYFGNSISLFTPLYLSNYCNSKCVYCGFQKGNKIARAKLNEAEIHEEMQAIAKSGLEEILMLTGEGREFASVEYIANACKIAREYFKVVGVEIYPMNEDEYKILHEKGCDYVTVFQETYNPLKYYKIHLAGEKRIFPYRFNAQERALKAGMRGVAFGA
ncbi:TPA: radical SAM protein, partial [Campylobacter jejuni]